MACLLHLSFVKTVLVPLETGAQAWASMVHHYVVSSVPPHLLPTYGVVLISPERFETQYAGRRPLPRRALLHDLKQIPENTFVALDLDISPMPSGSPGIGPTAEDREDERLLHEHIKNSPGRFALILPFPVQDPVNRQAKARWLVEMCMAGVTVADPRINLTLGVATRELTHADLSFSHVIRHATENPVETAKAIREKQALRFEPPGGLCTEITQGKRLHVPQDPPALEPAHIASAYVLLSPQHADEKLEALALDRCRVSNAKPDKCDDRLHGPLLSFGQAHARFTQFSWCAQGPPFAYTSCGTHPVPARKQDPTLVIFGGDYDLADRFATPLGQKSGAYLHAISALRTSINESHLAGLLADFALGLGFGLVAHGLWALWFEARRRRTPFRLLGIFPCALTPQTSWVALVLLALCLSVLTFLALLLAAWLLVLCDIWLSPVPMMAGMTLDAMVLGSAGAAAHKIGGRQPYDDRPSYARPGIFRLLLSLVPQLIWMAVVGYGLADSILHVISH